MERDVQDGDGCDGPGDQENETVERHGGISRCKEDHETQDRDAGGRKQHHGIRNGSVVFRGSGCHGSLSLTDVAPC